ncbi:MAG: sugar transferase [Acidobacteriota bacterium]|nr:sugar transferase [Blastocatellia bacterium]MDW8411178.1 sugar transferase [Acidobacteriota bacterium]
MEKATVAIDTAAPIELGKYLKYEEYLLPICVALVILLDLVASAGSFVLAYWLRQGEPVFVVPVGKIFPADITDNFRPYFSVLIFIPFVRILLLRHYDLYRLRGEFSIIQDFINILKATTVGSLVITSIAFLYRGGVEFRDFSYSRLVFIYDWGLVFSALFLIRFFLRTAQTIYRRWSGNLIPTLVVGTGKNAEVCIGELLERPRLGYRVVGVLTADGEPQPKVFEGVPVLGSFRDLPALARQYAIREVLITDERISPDLIFQAIMKCGRKHRVDFRVVPNLFNCLPRKTGVEQVGSLPMIKLFEEPLRGPNRFLKRAMDLVLSVIAIVFGAPVWLAVMLLIKLDSRGPAIYAQERVGMDGRIFRAYKFRSMYHNSDESLHRQLMEKTIRGEAANQGTAEKPIYGKVKDDPRITRVGAFIRKYSLDELPQVLNVLKGEMSFVGPRPPIPYEVEHYEEWHRARFQVKPGITGLWQVSGRNRLNFEQMVKLDIYYIENWSLWLDIKILFKTVPVVLKGDAC